MNKLTLNHYLNILALFLIAILFLLYFKSTKSNPQVLNSSEVTGSTSSNIAFVNADSLYAKYSKFKDLEKELETSGKSAQEGMQAKMMQLQKQYETLMKKAQSGQITPQQAQAEEQGLMKKKQQLEAEGQQLMGGVQEKSAKASEGIKKDLYEYFAANKSKYKCDVVIMYQSAGNILYFDKSKDITNAVLTDLNK